MDPSGAFPASLSVTRGHLLVQLPAYIDAGDIFSHYAYFSSFSTSWVEHADGPGAFYRRHGFEPTGEIDEDGEVIARLGL